jgi:hypothetical protein
MQQRADLLQSGALQLRPKLRRVAEFQHSSNLSNKEIACCLGHSLSATKSRLLRENGVACFCPTREWQIIYLRQAGEYGAETALHRLSPRNASGVDNVARKVANVPQLDCVMETATA